MICGGKRCSIHTLVLALILLAAPAVGIVRGGSGDTRAPGDGNYDDPQITVVLDSEVFYTAPAPYPDNTASVTGEIECIIPSYVPAGVYVKLSISLIGVDINYDGTKDLYATKDEPLVEFLISTYPKHSARAGERYEFEVEVLWSYSTPNGGAGKAESVYGSIEISPYGYVFMETVYQNPTMDIIIGEPFSVLFDLYNNGNSNCHVELAVVESPDFTRVTIYPTELDMLSFGHEEIEATVLQEAGNEQEGSFRIRVLSDIPGAPAMDEFTFKVRSHKEDKKVEFDPTLFVVLGFLLTFAAVMVGFMIYVRRLNREKKGDGGR